MVKKSTYIKIMRASAIYDLIATAPFVLPVTFAFTWSQLSGLHQQLGLAGTLPDPHVYMILLANLLGSVVVVWSAARLWLNMAVLGRFDAAARLLFATWQIVALVNGASMVLAAYLVVELIFGFLQIMPISEQE